MNDDWLDAPAPQPIVPFEGTPADGGQPGISLKAMEAGAAAIETRAKFVVCWESLSDDQRVFLNTWRECRFNLARTIRVLSNTKHPASKTTLHRWRSGMAFEFVENLMRSSSVQEILNKDYLTVRQEDIVETALTPAPILHQGFATGHFEVELGVASKANETLLKLGGHLKDKDIDVNVGIVGPQFVIQVVQKDGEVRDITPRGVDIELPELPASDDEWP